MTIFPQNGHTKIMIDEDLENEELGEEGDSVVADQQEQEILTEQPTEEPNDEEFDGKGESLEEIEQDPLEEVKPVFDLADTGVGFRNFDQINATYSALTGVPTSNPAVAQGFIDLKSTLPFDNELATITPGQVSAYTKLAAFYCDEATSDVALRPAIYGSLDFNQPVATAFNNPQPLASSILDRFFRPGYSQTPEGAADIQMLVTLLDEIKVGKDNTANVAMGLCTAVLSSAGVTVY